MNRTELYCPVCGLTHDDNDEYYNVEQRCDHCNTPLIRVTYTLEDEPISVGQKEEK